MVIGNAKGKGRPRWNTGTGTSTATALIHLRLDAQFVVEEQQQAHLERVAAAARAEGVFVHCALYLPQEYGISDKADPVPSLRIATE